MGFEITEIELSKAQAAGQRLRQRTPLAVSAQYSKGRVQVELNNGCAFSFPAAHAQGLENAKAMQLKNIQIQGAGIGLYWPELDADLYVPTLIKGILGSREWMREIGQAGGSVKSEKKAASSRSNGALGGRPKKLAALNLG